MTGVLEIHDDGHLRVLRLNRPERKNALDGALFGALAQAFVEAARDDDVWAVALTANGSAFCSGLDLAPQTPRGLRPQPSGLRREGSPSAAGPQPHRDVVGSTPLEPVPGESADVEPDDDPPPESDGDTGPAPAEIMAKLMRIDCEKPIVAGINGAAVGFGMSLAMAADIRIAAPSARFHPGYARVGTSPDGGATWTVTSALGYERAMRFFLESRMVPADEALAIGLVSEVTETDEALDERLLAYAGQLAAVAPIAAQQTKRLMGRITAPDDLEAHLRDEVRLARHGLSSEDGAEALRAMMERDTPKFTGR